jgi:hypothetical protein
MNKIFVILLCSIVVSACSSTQELPPQVKVVPAEVQSKNCVIQLGEIYKIVQCRNIYKFADAKRI